MPYKDIKVRKRKQKTYNEKWYSNEENKIQKRKLTKMYRHARKNTLQKIKETLSCPICNENENVCLDFHHLDRSEKDLGITDMTHQGWSLKRIINEINKCCIVCANCHRKIEGGIIHPRLKELNINYDEANKIYKKEIEILKASLV